MDTHEKDISGFLQVYDTYKTDVFKTAMRYSNHNYHVAEEITQEVFLKLYNHFAVYEEEYLQAWLMLTAKNAAINHIMKARREIPDEDIEQKSDLHCMDKSAEDIVIEQIETEEVVGYGRTILDELYQKNERWYDAVTMVDCLGRKPQEVAEELGISAEVFYSILYRARKWIKKQYDPDTDME